MKHKKILDTKKLKVALLTPPMTQLNTPYPATAYLNGFLAKYFSETVETYQADFGIELFHRLFSREGLKDIFHELKIVRNSNRKISHHQSIEFFIENFDAYLQTITYVVEFLKSGESSLAYRIVSRDFLPESFRFSSIAQLEDQFEDALEGMFGSLSLVDRAKHFASLYIDDIADVIRYGIDENFSLSRYAESLAASVESFDPLERRLHSKKNTLVEKYLMELVDEFTEKYSPDMFCITAPFPGNVYGAFQIAKRVKQINAQTKTLFGGGYVNTELRQLGEPRVFDYFDFVTLDDGYAPLQSILESLIDGKEIHRENLFRVFLRDEKTKKVLFFENSNKHDIPFKDVGTPRYEGLNFDRYVSMFEMLNPMHRLWSDGKWNKLTLAHGCYWKQCAFCDISLDYISRYEEQKAEEIAEKMFAISQSTKRLGFHFVDEAAPPKTLFALSKVLREKECSFAWWANVRFEKSFTFERAKLMAESGCIAVSGGLEVASDRLLERMQKGVTVPQVARVTRALSSAGILVHAYLMYGFPTQTLQESVDALEMVRQLFVEGCIQSAYWHRFSATIHSPIGKNPERYGITVKYPSESAFAKNDCEHFDPSGVDHDRIGVGLNKALYNFMMGIGLDEDVRFWFDFKVPKTKIHPDFIRVAIDEKDEKSKTKQNLV